MAWNLFRDRLYDALAGTDDSPDAVSYDLASEDALHNPLVIHWNRGLAAGSSLRRLEESTVDLAYSSFLRRFDRLHAAEVGPVALAPNVPITVSASRSLQSETETIRIALSELPDDTMHGTPPKPAEVYLPPSHRKAVHPNVMLVTGMRGSGKTFWWNALQDPQVRTLLGGFGGALAGYCPRPKSGPGSASPKRPRAIPAQTS